VDPCELGFDEWDFKKLWILMILGGEAVQLLQVVA